MRRSLAVIALVCSACGVNEAELVEAAVDEGEVQGELSTLSSAVVTLRKDLRTCAAPSCGGFYARDVNRTSAEVYVSRVVFPSGFTSQTIADALAADDGALLVRGRLGSKDPGASTRPLVATEVWQGMPGVSAQPGDIFYKVSRAGTATVATRLNIGTVGFIQELSTPLAARPELDAAWLLTEAYSGGAVVAGRVGYPRAWYALLNANQVFLKVGSARCTTPRTTACTGGKVRAFERRLDGCLTAKGCVTAGTAQTCGPQPSACPAGYDPARWVEVSGCSGQVCEPYFVR